MFDLGPQASDFKSHQFKLSFKLCNLPKQGREGESRVMTGVAAVTGWVRQFKVMKDK
jgi:hypothetical protein